MPALHPRQVKQLRVAYAKAAYRARECRSCDGYGVKQERGALKTLTVQCRHCHGSGKR